MTLREYQNRMIRLLEEAQVPCADNEAMLILLEASGKSRLQLVLDQRCPLAEEAEKKAEEERLKIYELMNKTEVVKRPYRKENLSDNLLAFNTSDKRIS